LSAVGSLAVDVGSGVVPVSRPIGVEVGCSVGEPAEGVGEDRGRLAWLDAPEAHPDLLDASHPLTGHRRRAADEDGAGDPASSVVAPEAADLVVQLLGPRVGTIHIGIDGVPAVGEVADELVADPGLVQGYVTGHDHVRFVPCAPQLVDGGRHEAQDAPCPLELLERGPVLVQSVEELGVDGVGRLQAPLVLALDTLRWVLRTVVALHPRVGRDYRVAGWGVHLRREEPAAHDLEPLRRPHRLPDALQPTENLLQPLGHELTDLAT
jgi:hypothetical protein